MRCAGQGGRTSLWVSKRAWQGDADTKTEMPGLLSRHYACSAPLIGPLGSAVYAQPPPALSFFWLCLSDWRLTTRSQDD